MEQVKEVQISQIKVGEHAQRIDDEDPDTVELAASMKRIGVLNPLMVSESGEGLILIAGHRRIVAARMAGLDTVPCIVQKISEDKVAEITFAENFFRKNLSPIELACALKDCLQKESMEISELAAGFHKSEHWVMSMIAIADWPSEVTEAIHYEKISVSAGRNLALVTEPEYRAFLVENAVEQGATARTTAAWLQAFEAMRPAKEAIQAPPVDGGAPQVPLVPQAPCLCCSQLFGVNEMSHVPVCGACVQLLRTVGAQQHS